MTGRGSDRNQKMEQEETVENKFCVLSASVFLPFLFNKLRNMRKLES